MGLAVLINNVPVGKAFFRSVYFLPTACSMVVASLIWRTAIFSGLGSSAANMLVHLFGVSPINWIGTTSPPWYWLVLVTVRLWNGLGFNIILFLAALQEIPATLYEAARIDGARRGWSTFRHITFPLMNNVSILVLLLNLISAFQAFDEFYNVLGYGSSGGGYSALVRPPLIYLFQIGFSSGDYGKGSAGAFILTAIIIGITIIQGRFLGFGRSEE
jgi:multiple sugar transport system permease protein